jgi:uncharacterized protein (DUF433 family)
MADDCDTADVTSIVSPYEVPSSASEMARANRMIGSDVVRETAGVCGGYPRVGNSRIPVRSLVLAYRGLQDFALVVETFPTLTPEEIRSALDWYIVHPMRVDEDIERNEQALRELTGRL